MTLKIRALESKDIKMVRKIHERDFPNFDFPRFDSLMSAFIIEDADDKMVIAGGVEAIAEALLVTNKEMSRIKIGKALVQAQRFAIYTCQKYNIRELHAFTTDDEYASHLIKHGFHEREEKVLRMMV